jgi:hypothetical protein
MIALAGFPADDRPRLRGGAAWALSDIVATIAIRKAVAKSTRRLLRGHPQCTISRTMQVKWLVGQNRSNCLKYSMQKIHLLVDQTQHLKSSFKSSVPDARRSVDRSSSALHTCQHTESSSSGNKIGRQKRILPANIRRPCEIKCMYRVKKLNPPVPPLGANLGVRRYSHKLSHQQTANPRKTIKIR